MRRYGIGPRLAMKMSMSPPVLCSPAPKSIELRNWPTTTTLPVVGWMAIVVVAERQAAGADGATERDERDQFECAVHICVPLRKSRRCRRSRRRHSVALRRCRCRSARAGRGGGALSSAGEGDIFVAKYDSSGNHLSSERFGDTGGDSGIGVAIDGSDNVVITGGFRGMVDFGGGALTSAGERDIFLTKFAP